MSFLLWWNDPTEKNAFQVSVISIIVTLVSAIVGITDYKSTKSSLMLCYGLENCVDFVSSAVVLWRFHNPDDSGEITLRMREKRASVAISFILFVLGFGITVAAMHDFKNPNTELANNESFPLKISFVSSIVFFMLTMTKLKMAAVLDSRALLKDGYCSLLGTILATSLFLNTIIVSSNPSLWWLDPFISITCGIASLFIGMRSILIQACEKEIPIWSPQWWLYSQVTMTLDELTQTDADQQQQHMSPSSTPVVLYEDFPNGSGGNRQVKETEMTHINGERSEFVIV